MSSRVDWVVMGPEPHLAHCLRCGRTIPKPSLPAPIDMAVAWMKAGVKLHAKCQPVRAPVRSGTPPAPE